MYINLFKNPLRFSYTTAEKILRRLFLRYNTLDSKEEGDLLVRLLNALRTFFSRIRRSFISDQQFVNPLEGPSSTKFNDLMIAMTDDMHNMYIQQNALDQSVVEVHNLLDILRESIESDLKIASENLSDLFAITSSVDAAVITFEDSFNTRNKYDEAFPTALEPADLDIKAGAVRLASGAKHIPGDLVEARQVRVHFDGELVSEDNTFSWGKLYGDPRDLGENGIRATFVVSVAVQDDEEVVTQGDEEEENWDWLLDYDDPILPGRPGGYNEANDEDEDTGHGRSRDQGEPNY